MFVEGSEGWCLDDFLLFFFSPLSPWWSTTDRPFQGGASVGAPQYSMLFCLHVRRYLVLGNF